RHSDASDSDEIDILERVIDGYAILRSNKFHLQSSRLSCEWQAPRFFRSGLSAAKHHAPIPTESLLKPAARPDHEPTPLHLYLPMPSRFGFDDPRLRLVMEPG